MYYRKNYSIHDSKSFLVRHLLDEIHFPKYTLMLHVLVVQEITLLSDVQSWAEGDRLLHANLLLIRLL